MGRNRATVDSAVGRVTAGASGLAVFCGGTGVLRGLRHWPACGAGVAAGHGTDGENGYDDDDDHQRAPAIHQPIGDFFSCSS